MRFGSRRRGRRDCRCFSRGRGGGWGWRKRGYMQDYHWYGLSFEFWDWDMRLLRQVWIILISLFSFPWSWFPFYNKHFCPRFWYGVPMDHGVFAAYHLPFVPPFCPVISDCKGRRGLRSFRGTGKLYLMYHYESVCMD